MLTPLRPAISSVVMACRPTSCSNSDVARNTAARDCSLRGRSGLARVGASGEF
jgi:hypothetical protein